MFRTLALAALVSVIAAPAFAADPYNNNVSVIPTLKLGAGSYNTFQDDGEDAVALKAEMHSTFRPWNSWSSLHPFVGVDTSTKGGYFANAGLAGDLALTPNWVVTPSLAAGFYEEGGAKDIGTNFALRPGLEVAYRFNNEHKIGLEVTSTTGVSSDDDSYESVTLNYHMPFGVFDM